MAAKFTFQQYKAQYPDDDACLAAILERRYGKADACPQCGVVGKLTKIAGRRAYACKEGCHTYPCAGTIFEHSSTSLSLWFHAMYLMTATRNGVSAKELQRQLGVTYKCAWRIGHQLRQLMAARAQAQNPGPMSGHVEMDETYIGGKAKVKGLGLGKGNYLRNKATVFGIVQRGGPLKGYVVPNELSGTVLPIVAWNVAKGTKVSTDQAGQYKPLKRLGYQHARVNHAIEEWVRGDVHTNTIEGFWSHLKRGIKSTHAAVSRKHLQKYVDEFAFRYNNREAPAEMFQRLVRQVSRAEPSR
jgi:transposase-like protein